MRLFRVLTHYCYDDHFDFSKEELLEEECQLVLEVFQAFSTAWSSTSLFGEATLYVLETRRALL